MDKKQLNRLLPLLLSVAAVVVLVPHLARPLWFDEALTILNFVMSPRVADVYWNYAIPNNHIFFTLLLRLEAEFLWLAGLGVPDLAWRSVSLAAAAIALTVMYRGWKRRCGSGPVFLVLLAFVFAPAFSLYAVAVRGYMLSFLTVLLAFEFSRGFLAGKRLYLLWYALASLAAVATIPTNLAALGAVALLTIPSQKRNVRGWLLTVILPPVLFLLFYLPLRTQLIHHLGLREGWPDGVRAALTVYTGFLIQLLPVILIACCGGKYRKRLKTAAVALMLLGPLLAAAVCRPYPFPRTFFAWWPLWLYLVAAGVHRAEAWRRCRRKRVSDLRFFYAVALMVLAWGLFLYGGQGRIIPGKELDDYFRPYYIVDYRPDETVGMTKDYPGRVYVSFGADPYPLLYYGLTRGMAAERWSFDGPRGRVSALDGCGLVILSRDEDPAAVARRFGIKELIQVGDNGYHRLYRPAVANSGVK